jgi:hypothetical protein
MKVNEKLIDKQAENIAEKSCHVHARGMDSKQKSK